MASTDVDPFLSQMEQPSLDRAQPANNRSRRISGKRPLPRRRQSTRPINRSIAIPPLMSRAEDDTFKLGNHHNHVRDNASSGFLNDHGDDDDDDDDDNNNNNNNAPLELPRLIHPRALTAEEILAKHIRLTTVYDPLHPSPDDEVTREGTALGLRPDHEGRLFLHQTLRLGRWCGMTGQRVDRDELMDVEKEMLDWKFEKPAVRRRAPLKEATGRGCMGTYLRRRKRVPRYEITRRRLAVMPSQEATTGTRRRQADGSAATAAAEKSPSSVEPGFSDPAVNVPLTSLSTPKTGRQGGGATTSQSMSQASFNSNDFMEAFHAWNAKKTKGEPTGTPQEWLAAIANRRSTDSKASSTAASLAPLTSPSTDRNAPKTPARQQGLPPRFLLPDGQVNISKVLDEQVAFIGSGGRADQFFAQYPGLQELMANPSQTTSPSQARPRTSMSTGISSITNPTPPPTVKRPTAAPATMAQPQRKDRRARVTEVNDAGDGIITSTTITPEGRFPVGTAPSQKAAPALFPPPPSPSSAPITLTTPPDPVTHQRGRPSGASASGESSSVAAGATATANSVRLDRSSAKRNVRWAPLPDGDGKQQGGGVHGVEENDDDGIEEIPREIEVPVLSRQRWRPGGALRAGRAGRSQYGWRR